MGWTGDVGLLVQSGLGTDEEEIENQIRRERVRGGENVSDGGEKIKFKS